MAGPAHKKKGRSTLKKSDAIQRIDKMVPMIVEDVEAAMVLKSALETGNEVVRKLRGESAALNFYGAHCYEAIRLGLILGLALTLAKLFDPAKLFDGRPRKNNQSMRSGSPNKSDIVSIPHLVRLLKQKRCRSTLGERARDWTPEIAGWEPHNEATALEALDTAVGAYVGFRRGHEGRSAANVLKNFRNKRLAHSLIGQSMKRPPRFKELSLLLEVAMKVTAGVRLAVAGRPWDIEDTREEQRRQGMAFWEPAINGVIKAENV